MTQSASDRLKETLHDGVEPPGQALDSGMSVEFWMHVRDDSGEIRSYTAALRDRQLPSSIVDDFRRVLRGGRHE